MHCESMEKNMWHDENYFVDPKQVSKEALTLTDREVHHLSRVKRHKQGDVIWAVDGLGAAYEVELIQITKSRAEGRILQTRRRLGEPLVEITLAQAMIKGDRFDWLVEKCVEIGVRRIVPFMSEKTIVRAGAGKINRWKRVALAALKQCGRSVLPEITEPKTFKQVCSLGADCRHRFVAHPGPDSRPVEPGEPNPQRIPKAVGLVGPEGGFTDSEAAMAVENGYAPVSLGNRRLRAETAGIVLTTVMLSQWGELC